jgi:hypothetical protein
MNAPWKRRRLARRTFKTSAILAALAVLGIAALLASLWLEHLIQFPERYSALALCIGVNYIPA